jgi:hypothetical protein
MTKPPPVDFQSKAIADFVAERRKRTGRKFETCERMKPVFKDLDDAGWNDWPPPVPDRERPR